MKGMKYLEHHSMHVYVDGAMSFQTSVNSGSDIVRITLEHYPELKHYFSDAMYYRYGRTMINGVEYVMIYNRLNVPSEFGAIL